MVTVTAEMSWSSAAAAASVALGQRATYLCFPGISARGARERTLDHALDLPIVDRQRQRAALTVGRPRGKGTRERRFALRGDLVAIAGCWRLEPLAAGVRVRLTLEYDIAAPLKTLAVDTLRSRSPLPIRTDADAILGRAVDEFFETRFAEQAAAYCERVGARLERPARARGRAGDRA
jgi:hypothetical protein